MNWNGAHFHLVLNHLPIIGTFVGLILLVAAMLLRSDTLKRTALIAFVSTAILTLPSYLTGESAEHAIIGLPGIERDLIETHQDAALIASLAVGILGAVAAYGFVRYRRAKIIPQWFIVAVLALAVLGGGLMLRAGNLGGQIRHTEIRAAFQPLARTTP